ncbi:MAG: threonine-phosphate decarboxylase [Deltaproteobacteria bacterium RBG_13_58_19]|nr:MAG: threonine-phosphate decarboxylase [Deltaproteobacteria bacterium RBG_13_58_19]
MAPLSENTPKHGGDVYHLARTLGIALSDLVDFSANINPLGYPRGIAPAVQAALKEIVHYPDRRSLELKQDLAAYHRLNPEQILVGNGSTELIYLAVRALKPRKALIVAPAFSEYEQALQVAQVPVDFHLTPEAHNFTLEKPLDPRGADLVFLANPASPSGALLGPERLLPLVEAFEKAGVYLLLDEAFIDFVEEASLKSLLARFPHLLILRSFTKFFGIPGIRLGYLLAAPPLIDRLTAIHEPWSVNTLAQAMGRVCLADRDFMEQTRELVDRERDYLFKRLAALPGLVPFPGAVNYLLVKLTRPGWNAAKLQKALLAQKMVIRDAGNFRGLDERFFRIAVRRREENEQLLAALEHCLETETTSGPA